MSTDDIPEPSLWYFDEIYFIKDQLEIAQTDTSEEPSIPHEDSQSQVNSESCESPSDVVTPRTPKRAITGKRRKGVPDSTDQLVGLATEYFKRPETEEDIVARGWLFEAEMGTLTREGVRCETFPRWSATSPASSCSSVNSWQTYPQSVPSQHTSTESLSYQRQHHTTSHEDNAATFFSSFSSM
ncbi:uncharacterized protein LOC130453230 [Diorhabda sublineata]|uniref:uncharacterized protein LOC130453230 n=1 Tax=Diorhabda sublineata TaxID=1163346 RepID=UPI0024E08E44|nr:uncharacterized protein LOC130453230 [Diorhabda sublineata]